MAELLLGTHSGLLKLVKGDELLFTSKEPQSLHKAIVSITPTQRTDTLLVARKNGILSLWDFAYRSETARQTLHLPSDVVSAFTIEDSVVTGVASSALFITP